MPQPRYFHSTVLVPAPPLVDTHGVLQGWGGESEAHLVVFGGRGFTSEENASEVCLSDVHILDLDTLHWVPSSLSTPSDMIVPQGTPKSKSTADFIFPDASEHQVRLCDGRMHCADHYHVLCHHAPDYHRSDMYYYIISIIHTHTLTHSLSLTHTLLIGLINVICIIILIAPTQPLSTPSTTATLSPYSRPEWRPHGCHWWKGSR